MHIDQVFTWCRGSWLPRCRSWRLPTAGCCRSSLPPQFPRPHSGWSAIESLYFIVELFDTLAPMFLRRISAAAKVSSDSAPTLKSVWKYKQVWSNKPKALYTGSQLQNKTPSIGYHECQGSSRCSINSSRHGSIHKLSKIGKKTPRFNISDQV